MNLLEYKKNAITYLDLVYSEIVNYKKKLEEVDEKVKEGLYTRALYEQKQSEYKNQATDKMQSLYNTLVSVREDVLKSELEQLQSILNKPTQVDNFAEIEMLKMLDYSRPENVEIFREYSKKYMGNKLAEAVLKQIETDVYEKYKIFLMGETSADLEQKLKDLISRIDSKVVQFHVVDYNMYMVTLEMYISGAKEGIEIEYNEYIQKKTEYKNK